MAIIDGNELATLRADNERMRNQLTEWETMAPFLELGKELQTELVRCIGSSMLSSMTVEEIGQTAYEAVKKKELDDARNKLIVEYEQVHRKALYEQLLGEVEASEGDGIRQTVFGRLDSDPELAKKLRDSARTELTARAHDVARTKVTEEQQAVIESETDRQIALDRADVAFALNGELDLRDPAVTKLLKPNDKLVLMFPKHDIGQAGLQFTWQEDIEGALGWVYAEPILPKSNTGYSYVTPQTNKIPTDRFVRLGSEVPNLNNGTLGVKADVILADKPLVVSWVDARGETQNLTVKEEVRTNYERTIPGAMVRATDFQTRDIEFVNSLQK